MDKLKACDQGNYGGSDDCAGELMADATELFRRYWNERLGGETEGTPSVSLEADSSLSEGAKEEMSGEGKE